ncbi:MAG: hypothetical protein NUV34_06195, partial [Sulfuricaulis sp.]|nr:hypothetical protein [Sulfuricaulis sp.]
TTLYEWFTNKGSIPVLVKARFNIYEAAAGLTHGSYINSVDSNDITVNPGQRVSVSVNYLASVGPTGTRGRDVGVEIWYNGQNVANDIWEDVVTVNAAATVGFDLGTPYAYPERVDKIFYPGETLALVVAVTNRSSLTQTISPRFNIYEGSILPGGGTLLDTISAGQYTLTPGQTELVSAGPHVATLTGDRRRDVGVEVLVSGQVKASTQKDDVFYVDPVPADSFSIDRPQTFRDGSWGDGKTFNDGEAVPIIVEVHNNGTQTRNVFVFGLVHEGAASGTGDPIDTFQTLAVPIPPGGSYVFGAGVQARVTEGGLFPQRDRDIAIEVWPEDQSAMMITRQRFDNVFSVQ